VLATVPNEISVEGHADTTPAGAPYATNWELAGARGTAVLRYLVETDGIDPARISATSFGSARPSPGDPALSRRVDIVLLTNLPDAAAALIPQALAASGG
jgi:chemotaxis protein MotB